MADILDHPYVANSAEEYPTSSLSELVRIYYQWSQAGGQRASLFNPGGASAAVMPTLNNTLGDWNFSTTDNFERRYSVLDLDQLAASLAEMEAELNPSSSSHQDYHEPSNAQFENPPEKEEAPENRANFEERVHRGAAAMEGLFDQSKPSYKYETKNDFVPVEERRPLYSDLPLRSETDRSSVTSTFIDLDFGAFDSSHYAAGSALAQPFQLADGHTIRATRSSGRFNRDSSSVSHSNSTHPMLSDTVEGPDAFEPRTGPRPPTMEWSFPAFMAPADEKDGGAQDEVTGQKESQNQSFQGSGTGENGTEKRMTMEWTFPVMSEETTDSSGDADRNQGFRTAQGPFSPLRDEPTYESRNSISGEPGDARLSTTASVVIETDYEHEHDLFHNSDVARTPSTTSFDSENEQAEDPRSMQPSPVLDGPGPDEEDTASVLRDGSPEDADIFTTAVPAKDRVNAIRKDKNQRHHHRQSSSYYYSPSESSTTDQRVAVPYSPLQTARPISQSTNVAARQGDDSGSDVVEAVPFPELIAPSVESMTEGADNGLVAEEMNRLLSDFLSALSATGNALAKVHG